MRKSAKVVLITTASIFAAGAVLTAAALCMGGGKMFYDNNYYTSSVQLETEQVENVSAVDFELGVNSYRILVGDAFRIEGSEESMKLLESYKQGDTWHIKTKKTGWYRFGRRYGDITIYIPENANLRSAEVQVGVGECDIQTLQAENISLQVGAGSLTIQELRSAKAASIEVGVGELNVISAQTNGISMECGMGSVTMTGNVEGNVDIDCGMGEVILDLENKDTDYNYNAQVGMGQVSIGDRSAGGIGGQLKQQNGANYTIEIDCGMGEVQVNFKNALKNEPVIPQTDYQNKEGNYNETAV